MHDVRLIVTNYPSSCADTFVKVVESFSPPLVGIIGDSTYCPVGKVEINAYGAAIYDWNTGSHDDNLVIGAPGGDFWIVGHSTTGCISDTLYFSINEEPDWEFNIIGDNELCEGDTTFLNAVSANKYSWNTGDTISQIMVYNSGKYKVTGTNLRGCVKSDEVEVIVYNIPNSDFNVSPREINRKNHIVNVNISQESDVDYHWDMGDGASYSGNNVWHNYDDLDINTGEFIVTLIAENGFGCADTTSKNVIVIPDIPNIFTPNGDGYNDNWFVTLSDYLSENIRATIFDRWGELITEIDDDQYISWNGKFRGQQANPGVYVYVIKCTDRNGEERIFSGDVTLLR